MRKLNLAIVLFAVMVFAFSPSQAKGQILHRQGNQKAPYEPVDFASVSPFSDEQDLLKVDFMGIGIGDAILLRCGDMTMIVDGGTRGRSLGAIEFMNQMGVSGFDYMLNTHPHDDHIDGQVRMLQRGFKVGEFLSPFEIHYRDSLHQNMVKELNKREISFRKISNGDSILLGEAEIRVIHNDLPYQSMSLNGRSAMLHIRYKSATMLLTADVTGQSQQDLAELNKDILKSQVLLAPHHGYNRMMPDFLAAVDPELVVVTNSRKSVERLEVQLKEKSIPRYYLASGGIHLETDGETWFVYQKTRAD